MTDGTGRYYQDFIKGSTITRVIWSPGGAIAITTRAA